MIQQWDFSVDEPVSRADWRHQRITERLPEIASRAAAGEGLRAIAAEYGISHEGLRRALARAGYATRPARPTSGDARQGRMHRAAGRGHSTALTRDEISAVCLRHGAGEGIRGLARAFGVSHETIRRYLIRLGECGDRATMA